MIAFPVHAVDLVNVAVATCAGNSPTVAFAVRCRCMFQRLAHHCLCCVWPLQAQRFTHRCTPCTGHQLAQHPRCPGGGCDLPVVALVMRGHHERGSLPVIALATRGHRECSNLPVLAHTAPTTCPTLPSLRVPSICPLSQSPRAPACSLVTSCRPHSCSHRQLLNPFLADCHVPSCCTAALRHLLSCHLLTHPSSTPPLCSHRLLLANPSPI